MACGGGKWTLSPFFGVKPDSACGSSTIESHTVIRGLVMGALNRFEREWNRMKITWKKYYLYK